MSLDFSKLVEIKPLITIYLLMRNFIANFARILGICKDFAGNRVNALGNIPRRGVVPKFSDLEVVALGIKPKPSVLTAKIIFFIVCTKSASLICQI